MLLFLFSLLCTIIFGLILCIRLMVYFFKRQHFPKKNMYLCLIFSAIAVFSFIYISYFFSFNQINRDHVQEGPQNVVSPNEMYTASAFFELYGGAAGGVNVWVEVINNKTNETKIIYYADAFDNVSLTWEEEDVLFIRNGYEGDHSNVTLNVQTEIYDEFGRACQSVLLTDYEKCYEKR